MHRTQLVGHAFERDPLIPRVGKRLAAGDRLTIPLTPVSLFLGRGSLIRCMYRPRTSGFQAPQRCVDIRYRHGAEIFISASIPQHFKVTVPAEPVRVGITAVILACPLPLCEPLDDDVAVNVDLM